MKRNIKAKVIEEQLKRGHGTEFLAEYFGIRSEDLEDYIRQSTLAKNAVSAYIRRIKDNDKRLAKRKSPKKQKESDTAMAMMKVQNQETLQNNSNNNEEEKLMLEVTELKRRLGDLELEHKEIQQRRTEIRQKLQNSQSVLKKLLEEMKKSDLEVQELMLEIGETSNEMQNLNQEMRILIEEIEAKEEKIKELKKISVLVYNSGEVETSEKVDIPNEWRLIYDEVIRDEFMGNFTINQLKGLSKAIALQNSNSESMEFVFECDEIAEYFEKRLIK